MKNTFGTSLTLTIFGESHGPAIGAVLDGLPAGMPVDEDIIRRQLSLRRPSGTISTARQEGDEFQLLSGVYRGKTTGTPLCIVIPNSDTRSGDYTPTVARPGHADLTAQYKYRGFQDPRGGGHFSGRITAALVAAGAILLPTLEARGIVIGSHLARCASLADAPLSEEENALRDQLKDLNQKPFATLSPAAETAMRAAIESARSEGDSVGGVVETAIVGLPAGLGEPWFDSLEGLLSHALFSIPAVKGVEFGDGFSLCELRGSQANDAILPGEGGRIVTATNHNGGIGGGISNGMPIRLRCAIKPTPTIAKAQQTVDMTTGAAVEYAGRGRHDPCIVHRARVVVDSVCALVVADLLAAGGKL